MRETSGPYLEWKVSPLPLQVDDTTMVLKGLPPNGNSVGVNTSYTSHD